VALDIGTLVLDLPAAVGVAMAAPFVELLDIRDGSQARVFGYVALVAAIIGSALRRKDSALLVGFGAAGGLALIPVLLIGMDVALMVENTRYLYLTAALTAPVLPLLVFGTNPKPSQAALTLMALVFVTSAWGTYERVNRGHRQSAAVSPVIELVSQLEAGQRVVVLTPLYDEATARFLMSRWLQSHRGIEAQYVMVGTGKTYTRQGVGGHDAAQSYFGPTSERFDPNTLVAGTTVIRQNPHWAAAAIVPAPRRSSTSTGDWQKVALQLAVAETHDPDDPALTITGKTLTVPRFYGPVADSELYPHVWLFDVPDGDALTGIELTMRISTTSRLRYGASYHELWGALFFMDGSAVLDVVSYDLALTQASQKVVIDLHLLDVGNAGRLALLPLNYPGRVSIEKVRIRR
jgi:hypothetical protein